MSIPADAAALGPPEGLPTGVVIIVALLVIILALAITCGVLRLCKKEERIEGGPSYSVAISNRLFKGKETNRRGKGGNSPWKAVRVGGQ